MIDHEKKEFALTQFVLKRAKLFWLFLIIVAGYGTYSYLTIPKEWSPDITIPNLIIVTPFPGASPIDSETLVTRQIETELQGISGLKKLTSTSADGLSRINVEFTVDTDLQTAKIDVRDAIDKAKASLPADAEDSTIIEIKLSEQPIFVFNFFGDKSQAEMRIIADDIIDDLEGIPGVLAADRSGGIENEMQVYVDPAKLSYYKIGIGEITTAIANENRNLPSGAIDVDTVKVPVRVPGEVQNSLELSRIVVSSKGGAPIYLSDLATEIRFGKKEDSSYARIDNKDAISIAVSKRSGENLQDIVAESKKVIAKWQETLGDSVQFAIFDDQSNEVQIRLDDINNNLILGFIFVVIVLMVVMGFYNAVMVAVAIPLSLALCMIVFQFLGITFNMVVLFSLVMCLGLVVDDAVVVVENIYRHLQMGKSRAEAVKTSVYEIAYPVITSTFTTIFAFVPLLFIPGIVGKFIQYLPITLILTLASSLVVALVFNPLICVAFMRIPKRLVHSAQEDEEESVKHSKFLKFYAKYLKVALEFPKTVVLSAVVLSFAVFYLYFGVVKAGVEFFPKDEPAQASVSIQTPYGTNLAETDRITNQVEQVILPYQEYYSSLLTRVGKTSGQSDSDASNLAYFTIQFPTWENRKKLPSEILQELTDDFNSDTNAIVGAKITIGQQNSGPPSGKPVEIEIAGNDLFTLKEIANQIKDLIKDTPHLVNLDDNLILNQNNITIVPDRNIASKYNISSTAIGQSVRAAINGVTASTYLLGKEEYDITVRFPATIRNSVENIKRIPIINQNGNFALESIANVSLGVSPGTIRHIARQRTVTISADVLGATGANVLTEVQSKLKDFELPTGYTLNYGGENESQGEVQSYMPKAFLVALIMIYLIMAFEFNSLSAPLIILSTVYLSLIGVFVGLSIHQAPLSVLIGGIGIVALAGIVVKNGIILIDYIKYKRQQGMDLHSAIVLSAQLRVRPIFLTATTSILGLMPIMIGMDVNFFRWPNIISFESDAGTIWYPLANAITYGLSVSTLLTLFFVPCLYFIFERSRGNRLGAFKRKKTKKA